MRLEKLGWICGMGMMVLQLGGAGEAKAASEDLPVVRIPIGVMAPREVPCSQALKIYFDWASGTTPAPEDNRSVGFMLVFNQSKNSQKEGLDSKQNLAGYTSGGLKYKNGVLEGMATATFSDRTFCPNPGNGFCVSSAPFNPNAVDTQEITLKEDGTLTTVLKSWGNATYVDRLVCLSNGVFYAPSKAGQNSMSVITLQKTGFRSPR